MQIGKCAYPSSSNLRIWARIFLSAIMSSALYNRVATVLILSQIAMSLGYRGAKLATPELASFTTSSASSVVPFPPSDQCVHSIAFTPFSEAKSFTAWISASVSVMNLLIATTTGTPKDLTFSMWRAKLFPPRVTALTFSKARFSLSIPPCIFNALIVATTTATSGEIPALRHLILKNFSAPRSAPNPASVTTKSAILRAVLVAMTELQPWAIFAKGPPWIIAGLFSNVWTRFGARASLSKVAIAPIPSTSLAKIGLFSLV